MKSLKLYKASDYLQLCRPKIAAFAALSAGFGLVLAGHYDFLKIASLLSGVFMVALGASGLNQYQEHITDALMTRTKERPIPSGSISRFNALRFALSAISAGLGILSLSAGILPAAIGLLAVGWYNGVYTYLKRKTAFAAVPGALTGALVPAIGWAAGGGDLTDPRVSSICIFFGLWQVPHFWLLVLEYGEEYETAGLPSLTRILSSSQISRITFVWVSATAVCGPMLLLFNPAGASITHVLILCVSLWLIWQGGRFMAASGEKSRLFFVKLNSYVFAIMTLLCCDRLYQWSRDIIVTAAKQAL
jgi:heme o synthase